MDSALEKEFLAIWWTHKEHVAHLHQALSLDFIVKWPKESKLIGLGVWVFFGIVSLIFGVLNNQQ